jgi:hypothetical protein
MRVADNLAALRTSNIGRLPAKYSQTAVLSARGARNEADHEISA